MLPSSKNQVAIITTINHIMPATIISISCTFSFPIDNYYEIVALVLITVPSDKVSSI